MTHRISLLKSKQTTSAPTMYRFSAGQDDLEVIPTYEPSNSLDKASQDSTPSLEPEKPDKIEGETVVVEISKIDEMCEDSFIEKHECSDIKSNKSEEIPNIESLTLEVETKQDIEEENVNLSTQTSPQTSPSHFSLTKSFRKQSAENLTPSMFGRIKGKITRTVTDRLSRDKKENEEMDYSKLRLSGSEPSISEYLGDVVEQAEECKDDPPTRKSFLGKKASPKPPVMSMTLSSLKDLETEDYKEENFMEEPDISIVSDKKPVRIIPKILSQENEDNFYVKLLTSSKHFIVGLFALVSFYILLPITPFINGLLIGMASTILFVLVFWWALRPAQERVIYVSPNSSSLPKLSIPLTNTGSEKIDVYKGWMNELPTQYNSDDFHVNDTQSVFVTLNQATLLLSRPRTNVPRRAMWNESAHKPLFINKRFFDLSSASISLLPSSISTKRRWLKKYPICISIPPTNKSADLSLEPSNGTELYLFARTDREKEEWFRRFECAINNTSIMPALMELDQSTLKLFPQLLNEDTGLPIDSQTEFSIFMSNLISQEGDHSEQTSISWLNVLIGRLMFNIITHKEWHQYLKKKIQRKLSHLKIPDVVEDLKVAEVLLGVQLPKILRMSLPTVDDRGVWVDFDVVYTGTCSATLETKVNLLKTWKKEGSDTGETFNIEEEDSDSSSDDNSGHESGRSSPLNKNRKFLWLVDKITRSQYFQHAVENKYIKKAVEEVSNTPLNLTVELRYLRGTLAVNIPPHPADRIWYGFRGLPQLELVARPTLGSYKVRHEVITEWIQKKIVLEFQKVMVLPNMDDLILPFLQHSPNYWSRL